MWRFQSNLLPLSYVGEPMTQTLEIQIGEALRARGWTICTAESCTGGLIMHRLTNVAGSSEYVLGGIVAYANGVKQNILKVKQGTLIGNGAVSEPVAAEMVTGVRDLMKADVAVSVTGIAGPGGGTASKPVGLVYIGLAAPDGVLVVKRHVFEGDRITIKSASAEAALALVLETLEKI